MRSRGLIPVHMRKMPKGFSLIELLIALAIIFIIMGSLFEFFKSQYKTSDVQNKTNEMNQNIRVAMDRISIELRMAGYKTGGPDSNFLKKLAKWIPSNSDLLPSAPYSVTMNSYLVITPGINANQPDMITFIYGYPVQGYTNFPVELDANVFWTDPTITVTDTTGFEQGDIIYIGTGMVEGKRLEFAKIVSDPNGSSTLDIDTDPNTSGQQGFPDDWGFGLYTKPQFYKGTEVGKINVVSFMVFNEANDPSYTHHRKDHPCLMRKRKIGNDSTTLQTVVEDIEFLEVDMIDSSSLLITLRARTSKKDSSYTDSLYNDHYRRRELKTRLWIRN
ncbi:MAG: PilW family protein [bacterium]